MFRVTVSYALIIYRRVLIILHVVKQKTANGDVANCQTQFVVKMVNIVAPMDTDVMWQQEHVHKILPKLSNFLGPKLPLSSQR